MANRYLISISIALALAAHALNGSAQTSPTPQFGIVPNASYQTDQVDAINMDNGNDVIKIPLFSLPQLGKLSLSFSAVSNATNWGFEEMCTDEDCDNYYIALNPTYEGRAPTVGSDALIGPVIVPDDMPTVLSAPYSLCGINIRLTSNGPFESGCLYSTFWTVYDSTGGSHSLYYDSTNISQLRTTDGTGYLYSSGLSDPSRVSANEQALDVIGPPVLYDSHGIMNNFGVGGTSVVQSDPDLNKITGVNIGSSFSPGIQYTDSVNRVIPPIPQAISSVAGCPSIGQTSSQPATSSASWQVPGPTSTTSGPNSATVTYLICYATVAYHTNFNDNGGQDITQNGQDSQGNPFSVTWHESTGSVDAIQSIVLPDGTYWGFLYDASDPNATTFSPHYGTLTRLIFPDGGSISYSYALSDTLGPGIGICGNPGIPDLRLTERLVSDGDGNAYPWLYSILNPYVGNVVTDPNGNDTVYQYQSPEWAGGSGQESNCDDLEVSRKIYSGSHTNGSLLRTVATTYITTAEPQPSYDTATSPGYGNALPQTVTTSLDTGAATTTTTGYTNQSFTAIMPTCFSYYDVQAGAWQCVYPTNAGPTPVNLVLAIPTSTSTTDYSSSGSGVLRSTSTSYLWQTNPAYLVANLLDTPATVTTYDGTPTQVAQTTTTYDQSAYIANQGTIAGHPTTTTSWLNINSGPTPTSYIGWNANGEESYTIDPDQHLNNNHHTNDYTYGSTYGGLYPTLATNALNQVTSYQYDFNTGHVTSMTDPNTQPTAYTYDCPSPPSNCSGRLKTVQYPDGGSVQYAYSTDSTPPTAQTPPTVTTTTATGEAGGPMIGSVVYDGLGRAIHQNLPNGSVIDTTYDGLDQVLSRSNPYFSPSDSTYGFTTYAYDALGRVQLQCQPDNGTGSGPCVAGSSYLQSLYSGNVTTSYDELRNATQGTADALGRLTQVVEPGSLTTTYGYNALGNLLSVNQLGNGTSDALRARSFTYDSLSRLLTSTNPETGTVCYGLWSGGTCINGYDANGNLQAKTDARNITTTYGYDSLNRLLSKTYSDSTPSSCFQYGTSPSGNTVGRLINGWTQNGACATAPQNATTLHKMISYDPMGRLLQDQRCTGVRCSQSVYRPMTYSYDLAGNQTGSGDGYTGATARSFATTYDAAGRLLNFSGGLPSAVTPLFTAQTYGPVGLTAASIGSQMTMQRSYDNRMRLIGEAVLPQPYTAGTATTTTLAASNTSLAAGNNLALTATISPSAATGSITFIDGSTNLGTNTLSGGAATYNVLLITPGAHSYTAVYGGDSNYAASASTAVTVTASNNSGGGGGGPYLYTTFNEKSAGVALDSTAPAIDTAGTNWSDPNRDWTYAAGGGIVSQTPDVANPTQIDVGHANYTATFNYTSSNAEFLFRYADPMNYVYVETFSFGAVALYAEAAGVGQQLAIIWTGTPLAPLTVTLNGSTATISVAGSTASGIIPTGTPSLMTGTTVGFFPLTANSVLNSVTVSP